MYVFDGKGLAQGSCVSSDLANIYLAYLDRDFIRSNQLWSHSKQLMNYVSNEMMDVCKPTCSVILRYLDDYLCISSSRKKLQEMIGNLRLSMINY